MNKETLKWYSKGKNNIGYKICYSNNINSSYLAKARTNSLQLEDHIGRGKRGYDKICKLCKLEEEDLEHLMVKCPDLKARRDREIMKETDTMIVEEKRIHILRI